MNSEWIWMLVLLAVSAFLSATEMAYSCMNRTRLKSLADHGDMRAVKTLALAEQYDELLSTILIGNNLVNIALASIGTVLFVKWIGEAGVTVSTVVVTVVVVVFGEISPKSLAKEAPEAFAMRVAPVMRVLMKGFVPLNWLFSQWKKLLNKLFRVQNDRTMTQDELITLVEEVEQEGGMNAEESDLLRSAIEFHDRMVSDILTPRVRIEAVSMEATAEEIVDVFNESGYSRLPVYQDTIDNIVGVLHQKDFYRYRDGAFSLRETMKTPAYVAEYSQISALMRLMQKEKTQMAVVVDEYGGTVGIVTMEDILEELVGEIWDEHDEVEEPIQELTKDKWRILGSTSVDDFQEHFDLRLETEATTVGGWVMELSGRIPEAGESFGYQGWQITVLSSAERHVQEVELQRKHAETK